MKEYKEKISSMTVEELKAEWDSITSYLMKNMKSYVKINKRTSSTITSSAKRL